MLSVEESDNVLKDMVLSLPDGSTKRVLLSGTDKAYMDDDDLASHGGGFQSFSNAANRVTVQAVHQHGPRPADPVHD